jgi:hypothetical protein
MEKIMSKTTTHAITAKSEVLDVRDELSPEELEAASGGGVSHVSTL